MSTLSFNDYKDDEPSHTPTDEDDNKPRKLIIDLDKMEMPIEPSNINNEELNELVLEKAYPKEVVIVLNETVTVVLFELPCKTVDKNSEDSAAVEEDNEKYDFLSVGKGRNRKTLNNETQTIEQIVRMKFTSIPNIELKNSYAFASKWDMFDSFAAQEKNGSGPEHKLKSSRSLEADDVPNDAFVCLDNSLSLFNSTIIMERVLSNNIFKTQHEFYKGILKEKSDEKKLLHLWSFICEDVYELAVTEICWNNKNNDILAIGYGKYFFTDDKNGHVAVWSIKNPMHPERIYKFLIPITSMSFSEKNPNLLAIGLYNGDIKVLDITFREKKIIAQNDRSVNPSYGPIWRVLWHHFDEDEQLISIEDNGEINKFSFTKTKMLIKTRMMNIMEVNGDPPEEESKDKDIETISITRNSSCLVFCHHPSFKDIYFIGTTSGYVYKCSMNNLHQYINVFQAHDGPIRNIQFSNFNSRIFLTCGADWCVKIWIEGTHEPLIVLKTTSTIEFAAFCPTHSTIIAAISNKNIYLWDLSNSYNMLLMKMKIDEKLSQLTRMNFTMDGKNLITGDLKGGIHVYNLSCMVDFEDNQNILIETIKQVLLIKPELLKIFTKQIQLS